ncbi:MAG: InlB B-repeat-containing protein [Peptoniphilaceae bacterium]|nr:InlB B-repeat-containing protein [Peptoniphilaceae bacterium]MDY5765722.1 InlB B-repeat-containing protein [Peptoniphilaceae bacterium]
MNRKKYVAFLMAIFIAFTFCISVSSVYAEDPKEEYGILVDKDENTKLPEDLVETNGTTELKEEKSNPDPEVRIMDKDANLQIEENNNISPKMLRAPDNQGSIEIQSFEDFKQYLEYKSLASDSKLKRFVLKGGNYEITKSFEIDLDDPYFQGKPDSLQYGLVSAEDEFSIKGNGNTISFKQDQAVALFDIINSPKYEIDGLKIFYPKDVSGFTFAHVLQSKETNTGYASANGMVKNIEVNVGGSVTPLKAIGIEKHSNHFYPEYNGVISSGFSWYIQNTNFENINIHIQGNIGSEERPTDEKAMVAAYGFTHHFGNADYTEDYNENTWIELIDKLNPSVLKDTGYIVGLNINVGGNILAYGNNTGYSAGVGQDMGVAWMENINLKIGGDIITDLKGNSTPMVQSYINPYAFGFSEEVMNLTDSSLEVRNIIFNGENLPDSSKISYLGAVAHNNSKGNYINIKNNAINVTGKIAGKSNQNILSSVGFANDWNSRGTDGTSWIQESEGNTYTIESINLESDKTVTLDVLGKKWRTGTNRLSAATLPEASLKNEKVTVRDMKITAKDAVVSLLMFNASNAKNNTLDYGDIQIKANNTSFYGMGNLLNDKPKINYYKNITENNQITMKNLNIESNDAQYISLMAGFQDSEQELKNNIVKADNVTIQLNSSFNTYIGGIANYSKSSIDSCRVFLGSINVTNQGDKNVYFGLGVSRMDKSSIKNSGVFVDSNISAKSKILFGGGFIGFAKESTLENNDFQINGAEDIGFDSGSYGGFAGWLTNGITKNNSSLILNDFMPFVGYADGGSIENCSHYINKKAPKYYSGLLASGKNNPVISKSTLIVEKDFEDAILYRKDNVSENSSNNYVVVVDDTGTFNRLAYAVGETTSTSDEMGKEIPVFKKTGDPIGKINIKERSFQDRYWNKENQPYEIGDAEKSFGYMTRNEAGKISAFGIDSKDIISDEGKNGHLSDYYHRHAGLVSENQIVYDLLGIRGNERFAVFYDGNGFDSGSVPTDASSYPKDTSVTVFPPGNLARKGYTFICWNTEPDGSATNYQAGESFSITEDTTLYAVWKKNPNIITFMDGDSEYAKVNVENGKTIDGDELTDESMPQNPTKSGYTFKEWNTQKDGKGTPFIGTTVVNKDMTVYAIYSMNAVTMNEAPTLEVQDKTIKQGEALDFKSLVVSAQDKEDGDLIQAVKVIDDGGFDKDTVGKYTVTFKVTDKDGASVTKKATITVIEKSKSTPNPDDNKLNPDNKKPQAPNHKTLPKTGDSSNLTLYGMLMGFSGLLLIAAEVKKRRKGRKKSSF